MPPTLGILFGWPIEHKQAIKHKIDQYGDRGYFNLENYRKSTLQVEIFIRLIEDFHSKGSNTTIVLMPEHSSLRKNIPQDALIELSNKLRPHLEETDIFDLRDVIDDKDFNDISHLAAQGREKFTNIFDTTIFNRIVDRN